MPLVITAKVAAAVIAVAAVLAAVGAGILLQQTRDNAPQEARGGDGDPGRLEPLRFDVTVTPAVGEGPFSAHFWWYSQIAQTQIINCQWARTSAPGEGGGFGRGASGQFSVPVTRTATSGASEGTADIPIDPGGRPGTYTLTCNATPGGSSGRTTATFRVPQVQESRAPLGTETDGEDGTRVVMLPGGSDGMGDGGMDGGGGCCGAGAGGMDGGMDHAHPGGEFGSDLAGFPAEDPALA